MYNKTNNKAGFLSVLSLVIGAQLGIGALVIPKQIAQFGIYGIIGWIITGLGAIVLALIFAFLSQKFSKTGGPHVFIKEAFGERAGKIAAWSYWTISWISVAPLTMFAIGSLSEIFGGMNPIFAAMLEVIILLSLMLLNFKGLSIYEIFLGSLRVLPLLIVPIICFYKFNINNIIVPKNIDVILALKQSSFAMIWAFIGIETGTTPGENVKNSTRTIPLALFFGTLLVTFIYISNSISIMGVLSIKEISESFNPYSSFMQKIFGSNFGIATSIFLSILCIGATKSWLLSTANVSLGAAEDKLFPAIFAKKNKNGQPIYSAIICTLCVICCTLLLKSKSIQEQMMTLIDFCNVSFIMIYFACTISFVKFMLSNTISQSLFKWLLVICSIIFCIFMFCSSSIANIIGSIIVPLFGYAMSFMKINNKNINNKTIA